MSKVRLSRRRIAGFTLVEVIVATAIGSMCIVALYRVISSATATGARIIASEQLKQELVAILDRAERYSRATIYDTTTGIYGARLWPPEIGAGVINPDPTVWQMFSPCRSVMFHRWNESVTPRKIESVLWQTVCPNGINLSGTDTPVIPGLRCKDPSLYLDIDPNRDITSGWNPTIHQEFKNTALCGTQNITSPTNNPVGVTWIRFQVGAAKRPASNSAYGSTTLGVLLLDRVLHIQRPNGFVEFVPVR